MVCISGAGFIVRRPIGGKISDCDPFLMLDHLGPVEYGPGEAVGAPDHPHRGFETVTYIVEGSMQHKDSAGNSGQLKEGWVQWMTAGSGETAATPSSVHAMVMMSFKHMSKANHIHLVPHQKQ